MFLALGGCLIQLIDIRKKVIELEDGTLVEVEPFAISKTCVSVAMYRAFQAATGYLTISEKRGGKLYYDNELIEHLSPEQRLQESAYCMCLEDALHFCHWADVRLPTEAEWIAGNLIDDRIYDICGGEDCPWYDTRTRRPSAAFEKLENVLSHGSGPELTSTRAKDGRVVVRGSPRHYREADWRTQFSRHLVPPDKPDLLTSFRVCPRSS